MLSVKKLNENAIIPTKGTNQSIGYDLYSPDDFIIKPNSNLCLPLGIAIEFYPNYVSSPKLSYYGRIAPRSSLSKNYIDTMAGVIDPDYRGEVKVMLINHGDHPYHIKKGNRIAQLIIEAAFSLPIYEVEELSETSRNDGGFGSTGK